MNSKNRSEAGGSEGLVADSERQGLSGPTPKTKKRKVDDTGSDNEIDLNIGISDRFRAQIDALKSSSKDKEGKTSLNESLSKVKEQLKSQLKSMEKAAKENFKKSMQKYQEYDDDENDMEDKSRGDYSGILKSLKSTIDKITSSTTGVADSFNNDTTELIDAKNKDIKGSTIASDADDSRMILEFGKKADKAHARAKEAFMEMVAIAGAAR
jgi:hypothetical protein